MFTNAASSQRGFEGVAKGVPRPVSKRWGSFKIEHGPDGAEVTNVHEAGA